MRGGIVLDMLMLIYIEEEKQGMKILKLHEIKISVLRVS